MNISCASKIAASACPASAATLARSARISLRAAARAVVKRAASVAGCRPVLRGMVTACSRHTAAGPAASPGAGAMPVNVRERISRDEDISDDHRYNGALSRPPPAPPETAVGSYFLAAL